MRRSFGWAAAIICPALTLAILIGCGGTKPDDEEEGQQKSPKSSQTKGGTLAALDAPYTGTLTGKVTVDGKPDIDKLNADLQAQMKAKDEAHCLAANAKPEEKEQQSWRIGKDGGLEYVYVWIVPPKGKYFKVDMNKKTWLDKVVIDQPHCAFVPHAVLVFPKVRDDKGKLVPTNQPFTVQNSAEFNHNTNVEGGVNEILPAKGETIHQMSVALEPSNKPIEIKCNIHTWMNAYALALDHPYAAITKPNGTYTIENVPTGVDVQIIAWHEKAGYLNQGSGQGEPIKLDPKTEKNFTAKPK